MSNATYRKKLIEVALPLEAINKECTREKNNPFIRNHPRVLHQWWARRPNVGCRALLIAQMIDDPSSHPEKFPTETDQMTERNRLFELIVEASKWENNANQKIMNDVFSEIIQSNNNKTPIVYDPFSGGG